ncbi:MAG: sigma-54-dependent Fis family transcriptional regulator [Ignavibacteriae bacterium]|nr:sigma-54-dependent Fis family transcriptional regulator [Ignavibacteriota bacterium]
MFGSRPIRLLLIEDEEYDVRRIRNTLKPFSDRIEIREVVSNGYSALDLVKLNKGMYDVVIMDFQIAGGLMGEQLIREIKSLDSSIEIIVVTKMTVNISDFEFADGLLQAGAFWYCTKYPGDMEESIYQPTDFVLSIINAFRKRELEAQRNRSDKKLLSNVELILAEREILGTSPIMQELRKQVQKAGETNASVLVTGPSGSGKEVVAQNIHYRSKRRLESFLAINCGSLPADLVESELFGYEKGAFTGANSRKLGLFEHADRGTIFLDEVGELPTAAQVKLLRVLQEGEIEKIGRTDKIKVDVRVIAATNKDIEAEVESKNFREDLFYRLNVLPIVVPALKEHKEDIELYFFHFLKKFCNDQNKLVPAVEPAAIAKLAEYDWPGNVRQLKNFTQRLLFDEDATLSSSYVEAALAKQPLMQVRRNEFILNFGLGHAVLPWRQMERSVREQYFTYVRKNSESDSDAAKKLGLAPSNYHRMCKELGLK